MSADIADRAYRVAVELESRATTWESIGRPDLGAKDRHHAAIIHELLGRNAQLVAAMADAARAVATSTTERCAEVADAAARQYAENARMAPPGATDALARSLAAEHIARQIRATGRVQP